MIPISDEDRESIIMARQEWRDTCTMATWVEQEEAKDALISEIIRIGAAPEVLIIDEQALDDLLEL